MLLLWPMPGYVAPENANGTSESGFDLGGLSPRLLCDLSLLAFASGRNSRGTYPDG